MSATSIHTIAGPFGVVPLCVATSPEVQALSHRALRLYLVLLARHNAKRDGWAWSLTALANDTGIARNKVHYAIHELSDAGLVEVEAGGGRASTHYRCLVPPSLRLVPNSGTTHDSLVPTAGTSPDPLVPNSGTAAVPTAGTSQRRRGNPVVPNSGTAAVPTAGTTRQRSYNDETEDPPYPHNEQNRAEPSDPPSPPASRGEQKGSPSGFELPERMRGAKLPPGSRFARPTAPAPAQVAAPVLAVELPSASRGDLVRQLARDIGVRPREARRMLEREDAIAASPAPPPPLQVDAAALDELRALGWLTPEQEAAASRRTA